MTGTGVLKARVNGEWVTVASGGGGSDEVSIAGTDPISAAPTTELWVDTTSPTVLTNDNRWYTAWGIIASGTLGGIVNLSVAGTWYDFTPTLGVTLVAGRRYRFYCLARAADAGGGVVNRDVRFRILDAGVEVGGGAETRYMGYGIQYNGMGAEWIFTGDGNAHTYKVQATASGAISVFADAAHQFYIEDVGPVVGTTTSPPPIGGLPTGMKVYGPYETAVSATIAPQAEGTVIHTHNLALPDTTKVVCSAHAMDGSWAAAASWRTTIGGNNVTFNILNGFAAGGYNMGVKFRYILFVGA